jgi:hypothetical protein
MWRKATAPPRPEPDYPTGPGLDAQDEAVELAGRQRGGFNIPLWRLFRERDRELVDP